MWPKENISDFFIGVDTKHSNDRSFVPVVVLHPTRTLSANSVKSKYMLVMVKKLFLSPTLVFKNSHEAQRIWKCVFKCGVEKNNKNNRKTPTRQEGVSGKEIELFLAQKIFF